MDSSQFLNRKKIYLITEDTKLQQRINQLLQEKGAVLFHTSIPKQAVADAVAKNPDLVIYDESMPAEEDLNVLNTIKMGRPKTDFLLLTKAESPQRFMDTSGRGVSYSIQRDVNDQMLIEAIEHSIVKAETK